MAAPREAAWHYDPLDAAATISIYLDHFTNGANTIANYIT